MNGFGMYPTPLQSSGPLTTAAPGFGALPPASGIGTPPGTFSGAPASPAAAGGASPYAALAGLIGGAIGPNAGQAAAMPLAQQMQLMSGAQTPAFGGGGLAPGDALAALIAGTNF